MDIKYGNGQTSYGPGVSITLSGHEVARAIYAYLVAHGIHVDGPKTVSSEGKLMGDTLVYVDPSGFVIYKGVKYDGKGPIPEKIMSKKLLNDLLEELDSIDSTGVFWDQNWQQIRECSHHPEYIRVEDLNKIIEKYK